MITEFSNSDRMAKRAQELIPGGCHTYSKGADQSPQLGPKFIVRGKGSKVWDVDGNKYIDWAMGLTSVSLGHAFKPVLDAVKRELPNGSNFQCPSPLEVELAELFTREVPTAEMVKLAKNGSTVTTAAVKLARAYTGRKYVAFCEDHGFFSYDDWYVGKKANNSGVPQETAALSLTFKYNDIASVEKLFNDYPGQIACVILEPMEFDFPKDDYLRKVQALCRANGTVFVLDEMITGFKLAYPGAHTMLGMEPDLTTWGKGLANGFSVCALAGRRDIMKLGGIDHDKERVFLISTTHGAETHSIAAAIETIRQIKQLNAIEKNIAVGDALKKGVNELVQLHGLGDYIEIKGHSAWPLMIFRDGSKQSCMGYKTLFMQETVKKGVLFRGTFTPTISHTEDDVRKTMKAFDAAMKIYKKALEKGGYSHFLVGEPVKPVFRKWN